MLEVNGSTSAHNYCGGGGGGAGAIGGNASGTMVVLEEMELLQQ
jgi:hypothetical protein